MRNGSYLEVEPGVELYYESTGEGDPLIFIPGWTFTTEVFDKQVAHFAKSHRVVSFDPRSQGRSTITVHGNDYAIQSADLCKLIDHLDLADPVIVGWSYGCLPMWGFVRLRGTKSLKGLVFIDMPPAPVTGRDEDWVEMCVADARQFYQSLTTSSGHRATVAAYAEEAMVQRDLSEQELNWIIEQSTRCPHWAAAAYCAAGMFSDYLPEAQEVDRTLRALFVLAEASTDSARLYLDAHLPNAQLESLGRHFMFWEHAKEFNAILETYLRSLAKS
jgi:pimeloyl-ACP methyl ester carboxylesterase